MKGGLKRLASVAFVFVLFAVSAAENQFNDGIDRTDPNFVLGRVRTPSAPQVKGTLV